MTEKPLLRRDYEAAVSRLAETARLIHGQGRSSEEIARVIHAERRALGERFKALTPPEKLKEIYARTLKRYGDKLGPSIEWLRAQGKSWQEIVESASRPGGKDLGF